MTIERSALAAVAVDGRLFAIGGRHGGPDRVLSTVDAFDPQTGMWAAVAPDAQTARHGLGAAVLDGKIYAVVGGDNRNDNQVEVYDPATNAWSQAAPMSATRRSPGVAVLGGKL